MHPPGISVYRSSQGSTLTTIAKPPSRRLTFGGDSRASSVTKSTHHSPPERQCGGTPGTLNHLEILVGGPVRLAFPFLCSSAQDSAARSSGRRRETSRARQGGG